MPRQTLTDEERKERHRASNRKWRNAHLAERREKDRKWRADHPEWMREYNRRRREENPEAGRARAREWRTAHPGMANEKVRQYQAAHPERVIESRRKWQRANPDKVNAKNHKRRARIAGNGGSFTAQQWQALCEQYGNRCLCCGEQKPLTVDHIVPIAKGGQNSIDNIQPLCSLCNSKKHTGIVDYRKGENKCLL